jgi:hypothetical protein
LWPAGFAAAATAASVTRLDAAQSVAWPSLYADHYADKSALPVQYVLHRISYHGAQLGWGQPATDADLQEIDAAYGDGPVTPREFELDNSGQASGTTIVEKGVIRIGRERRDWKRFAVRVMANPHLDPANQAAVNAMIALAELDRIQGANRSASVDRRTELRTLAFLRARYLRNEWNRLAQQNPAAPDALINSVRTLVAQTMTSTGYWGVWLSVFAGVTDAQVAIANAFTGTHPRRWAI